MYRSVLDNPPLQHDRTENSPSPTYLFQVPIIHRRSFMTYQDVQVTVTVT